jgi:hypothetical protein
MSATFQSPKVESGNAALRQPCVHPAFPSEACAIHVHCGHDFRQVFGLADFLLASASQFMAEPVLYLKRSFLLTAAGQFRTFTGFPFQSERENRHRKCLNYRAIAVGQ